MKQKKRILAVLLSLCVLAAGPAAFAADLQSAGDGVVVLQSTLPDGSVVPYTMYIATTRTTIRSSGSNTISYTLNMSTTRNVKAYCYATLQRYAGNDVWTDASDTRYYEEYNCNEFYVKDSVSNLPSGQYRVVVDYYAELNGYTDYVYSTSSNYYL